jgi:anhydro-N-acetylmuramic acid kinase
VSATPDLYIGIMSGTSLDGIDTALVDLSRPAPRLISSHFQPYAQPLKDSLLALHHASHDELHQSQLVANRLAREYADTTKVLLKNSGVSAKSVQAIGCHGQTVRHRPEHGYTIQLNNAALLAELTGIHVVSDFRSRDIAAGGQGAPLVPAFHDKVLRHPKIHRAILNIGGIANLTDLAPGQTISDGAPQDYRSSEEMPAAIPAPDADAHRVMAATIGFDSGPGNLLMDAWITKHQGKPYDKDGAWAASGRVIPALLQRLLAESYFDSAPPKSTGRDLFNLVWLEEHLKGNEAPADVQATLLALTGDSIASAVQRFCKGAEEIYLCGGGAHNLALVAHLQRALPGCRIQKTEVLGIAADWMEAVAFAWLAQQTMHLRPGNLPAVTGAKHPCVLGAIYPA